MAGTEGTVDVDVVVEVGGSREPVDCGVRLGRGRRGWRGLRNESGSERSPLEVDKGLRD